MSKNREAERALFYDAWDGGDPWGSTISQLFGIAEAVYAVDGEVWEHFGPGLGSGDPTTEEWPDCEYVAGLESGEMNRERLHHWYRVLLRYDAVLRHAGLDY